MADRAWASQPLAARSWTFCLRRTIHLRDDRYETQEIPPGTAT